ncbi:adenine phosphoribosyltransferase [Deinococcus frigens]|uniref:adenine phosphoribosyltransferase n=1 Tax=Deinococcus frigens TaxID=249403 RepID=UPI000496438B|nr:adenine phosphoribosyltransferase [Deinococcus frigens]
MTQARPEVTVKIGGVTRILPSARAGSMGRVPLVEFIGDSEFTKAVAEEMLVMIPGGTEVLLTVVTNALPLAHELSHLSGLPYECVRKKRRPYMQDPIIQDAPSMTLGVAETFWLDSPHAARLKGKKVAIVQDVISSGGTAQTLARIAERAGGTVTGYLAAFRQGESALSLPFKYLEKLPAHI